MTRKREISTFAKWQKEGAIQAIRDALFREFFFSETLFSEGTTLVPRAHDTRTTPRSDRNRPALTYRDNMTATNQPNAGQAIPGLLNDIVTTFVFRSDFLPDTRDLARLRAVSCAMRDAVDATGRPVYELTPEEAVRRGDLNGLQLLLERAPRVRRDVCAEAAKVGNLDVLKWARENDCPWDETTCAHAALRGHLEILKWARENDCPWNGSTCSTAAYKGRLEVLKWARENGCPWTAWTCAQAAYGGHLEVLKWARENGCPWDSRTIAYAYPHHEVRQWAILNGCPQGYDDHYDSGFDTEFGHSDDPFGENDSEEEEDDGFW